MTEKKGTSSTVWVGWVSLALAILVVFTTPAHVLDMIHQSEQTPRMLLVLFVTLPFRLLIVGVFLWIWWKMRPPRERKPEVIRLAGVDYVQSAQTGAESAMSKAKEELAQLPGEDLEAARRQDNYWEILKKEIEEHDAQKK